MEGLVKGDLVVVPFPFSDLSASKRRPALVLAVLPGDDLILCQITSADSADQDAVPLSPSDLADGRLTRPGFVRPRRLFTGVKQLALSRLGRLKPEKLRAVVAKAVEILQR